LKKLDGLYNTFVDLVCVQNEDSKNKMMNVLDYSL